jgi:uncharacterized damage-inducible protein DinB
MALADTVADLLRHMEWADALIWGAVFSSPAATADAQLHERLYHVHVTQHAFLQVWRGAAGDLPAASALDRSALAQWARAFYAEALAGAARFDEESLARRAPDALLSRAEERLGAGRGVPTIGDTVLQVVTHSAYHRGQINTRLRELGCEPPLTEYFVWVWAGKPAATWPAGASPAGN